MIKTRIEGAIFEARLDPQHPYLWHIYDKRGRHLESFSGSEDAVQSHVAALDAVRNENPNPKQKRSDEASP